MLPRAFCESLLADSIALDDSEAHHLQHVLRLKPGDHICLFDGCGVEADAVITRLSRREVFCSVRDRRKSPPATFGGLTVLAAPPKADRLKWMVEKLTEIGVERLVLLQTERTIVTPGESRIEKLRSSVVSACKQCRRNDLMQLSPLQSLSSVLEDLNAQRLQGELWIAHPAIGPALQPTAQAVAGQSRLLLIGPEGGFTDNEFQTAVNAGARIATWPNTVLRIETAAIVFAAQLLAGSMSVPSLAPVG